MITKNIYRRMAHPDNESRNEMAAWAGTVEDIDLPFRFDINLFCPDLNDQSEQNALNDVRESFRIARLEKID